MRTRHRFIVTASCVVLATAALGLAGPAQADPNSGWVVTSHATATMPPPDLSPAPGPASPQAGPDGWHTTRPAAPARAAAPSQPARPGCCAATSAPAPSAPQATRRAQRKATPSAPRVRRIAHGVTTGTWHVVDGEMLGYIAWVNHTTVGAIVRANLTRHPQITEDYVQAGWTLRIPGGKTWPS